MAFGFDDPVVRDMRRRAEAQRLQPQMPPSPQPFGDFLTSLGGESGGLLRRGVNALSDNPSAYSDLVSAEREPAPWEYGPPAPQIAPPGRFNEPDMEGVLSGASSSASSGVLPQMPGVSSGASSTAGPSVGLPPPPQPSGLRVKLQGGDWQEADSDGRLPMPPTERSGTAYDPVDRRVEPVSAPSGGGTFSMMTAPENEDIVTRGSQLEDAQFRAQMREYDDPLAQQRESARIGTDERIRFAEAQDRISMGKQAKMAQEAEGLQAQSDQNEFALAQKYGIDPRDTEGQSIQDEGRRMQYQQERESLKREIQAQMTILLSRYGMAPRSAAGYEALSGF
jgi:hypothetical protein